MRDITREMIDTYNIKNLRYDFMGYTFRSPEELSFHHLVVPRKDCKKLNLGDGYFTWNGAILNQHTSHDYLHVIERVDRDSFLWITDYMMTMNINKEIDIETLKKIRKILLSFEKEHKEETNSKGKVLIKQQFITNRIQL